MRVQLLGAGLDAIIQRDVDAMPGAGITAEQRLHRYQRAACAHPDRWRDLRARFGAIFLDAWRAGRRPNLKAWHARAAQIERACR